MPTLYRTSATGFVCFHDSCRSFDSILETEIGSEINIYDWSVLEGCAISTPKGSRVEIGDFAVLRDCSIKGSIHLEGLVYAEGCEFEPDTWLHAGVWMQPPLMTRTDKWVFSECVPGYIHCQCQCHKIEEWERAGVRFGERFGLTAQEIFDCEDAAKDLIAQIRARE